MYPIFSKKDPAKRFHPSTFDIRYSAVLRFAFYCSFIRAGPLAKETARLIEKETVKSKGSKLKAEGSKLVGWALPTNHLKPET
jgi:hypothetical protein